CFWSFCLIAVLLLSMACFVTLPVSATDLAMQYGHLTPDYDQDEKNMEAFVCDYIYELFWEDIWSHYEPINSYWAFTNQTCLATCLDYQRSYSGYVTNWWVGDYHADPGPTPSPGPYGHLWFYGEGDDVSDDFVHDHITNNGATSSNSYFSFIWTCANGGRYWNDAYGGYYPITGITVPASPTPLSSPPINTNTKYGFWNPWNTNYGMPFAWTGRLDMSLDGYNSNTGDYCYIGFEGPSPFMLDILNGRDTSAWLFPIKFYSKALGFEDPDPYYLHQTVHDSLDFASQYCYDENFDDTELYQGYWQQKIYGWFYVHMRVSGNSGMII
ncbi:MAG: hypothetical protein ACQCN5_01105, partial [Candidatus Bathyarchaeia archaeon]